MPICQNTRDPAQRRPSLATDPEGRDPRTATWTAPGLAAACGHLLYKGKESELVRRHALRIGRRRTHRRAGGAYAQTSS
jgi:hypothetical protein